MQLKTEKNRQSSDFRDVEYGEVIIIKTQTFYKLDLKSTKNLKKSVRLIMLIILSADLATIPSPLSRTPRIVAPAGGGIAWQRWRTIEKDLSGIGPGQFHAPLRLGAARVLLTGFKGLVSTGASATALAAFTALIAARISNSETLLLP